jgi:hypothetical protein
MIYYSAINHCLTLQIMKEAIGKVTNRMEHFIVYLIEI